MRNLARALIAALAVFLANLTAPAAAQTGTATGAAATHRISWSYEPAINSAHDLLRRRMQANRVLEQVAAIFQPVRFPRPVLVKAAPCGEVDAWYADGTVTVCYEYMEYILKVAHKSGRPQGLRARDAVVGAALDVFFHEMGHAIVDLLDIPVLGREEDAADQISIYLLLQFRKEKSVPLVQGVAWLMSQETRDALAKDSKLADFADEHGLPAQRYFNVLCLAYGFDRKAFAFAVEKGNLPRKRARKCGDEYRQVDKAFRRLVGPFIDWQRVEAIRKQDWFVPRARRGRSP